MTIRNIALRLCVAAGVVLSALYLIWPSVPVSAGRTQTIETVIDRTQDASVASASRVADDQAAVTAPGLNKVSLDSAAKAQVKSLQN